jgi:hypothetical protein
LALHSYTVYCANTTWYDMLVSPQSKSFEERLRRTRWRNVEKWDRIIIPMLTDRHFRLLCVDPKTRVYRVFNSVAKSKTDVTDVDLVMG